MRKPVIGVLANHHLVGNDYHIQGAGEINLTAVCDAAGAIPLVVPSMPDIYQLDELRDVCDGFIFTGGRPNVHPEEYGEELYPEIRDLPGRDNHRMPPDGTLEEKFAMRHEVTFTDGGPFHRLLGDNKVVTNSLHGQGIKQPGARVVVDGYAPDGTPEAIYIKDAPGFTLSVQWHPEWQAAKDDVSAPIYNAFADACRAWVNGQRMPLPKSA